MKYIKMTMTSFFATALGCFVTLGATNKDFTAPTVVVFIGWFTFLIMMIFEEDNK